MTALTVERPAATTSGWPRALLSAVCAVYAYLLVWLALTVLGGALLLGARPTVIASGSMEPALRPGDVVLTSPPPDAPLAAGAVVTFGDPASGRLTTHRVVEVSADGRYVTRGDASPAPDPAPVPHDAVVGVGRLLVPTVGLPLVWAGDGRWGVLAGWGALTVLAVLGAAVPARPPRRERPEGPAQPARPAGPVVLARPAEDGRFATWHGVRRRRRPSRAAVTAVAAAAALTAAASVGTAAAAFVGSTASSGNAWAGLVLEPPGAPAATCTNPSGEITVTWSATSSRHDGYVVRRGTASGTYDTDVAVPAGTTSYVDAVAQRTTYFYVVETALGAWRAASAEVSAACAPGGGGGAGGGGGTGKA